jgi:hypothetical protein
MQRWMADQVAEIELMAARTLTELRVGPLFNQFFSCQPHSEGSAPGFTGEAVIVPSQD